jgi:hypothetical protein
VVIGKNPLVSLPDQNRTSRNFVDTRTFDAFSADSSATDRRRPCSARAHRFVTRGHHSPLLRRWAPSE